MEETLSVIYNSLRYDDAARLVTFHLRGKDWDELKSNSARMWIASSDLLAPVIQRDTIFLESDRVKAVKQIDPVEKFGLFAVQTFEVELSGDCEILKVNYQTENKPRNLLKSTYPVFAISGDPIPASLMPKLQM